MEGKYPVPTYSFEPKVVQDLRVGVRRQHHSIVTI